MNEAIKDSQNQQIQQREMKEQKENHEENEKSLWSYISDGAKSLFSGMFGSNNSYTPLDQNDSHGLFSYLSFF